MAGAKVSTYKEDPPPPPHEAGMCSSLLIPWGKAPGQSPFV